MFGSKHGKQERLAQYETLLRQEALTPTQIAARLGVPRSTVSRDLLDLDAAGVPIEEDERGRLRISRWWQ
jgi:predicted DNA-binding transcriptional regulator YafY